MIFEKYAAFFQPHELDALTAAYDRRLASRSAGAQAHKRIARPLC